MTRYQKIVLALGALAAAILMLGWLLPQPDAEGAGERADPPLPQIQACTEIGCESGMFLNLVPIARSLPEGRRATFCIDDVCKTTRLRRFGGEFHGFRMSGGKLAESAGGKVTVRLRVTGKRGKTLRRQKLKVAVERLQPNGEDCPPVCFQVMVGVRDTDGRLIPLPAA